jgi:hypothetical protein
LRYRGELRKLIGIQVAKEHYCSEIAYVLDHVWSIQSALAPATAAPGTAPVPGSVGRGRLVSVAGVSPGLSTRARSSGGRYANEGAGLADDLLRAAHLPAMPAPYEHARTEVVMKHCHSCGLSIGETATFCATCGALVPVSEAVQPEGPAAPAPVAPTSLAPEAAPETASPAEACRLCGQALPDGTDHGVCPDCAGCLAEFVVSRPDEAVTVSLAAGDGAGARGRVTAVNAIYSAIADEDTCPECLGMDGRETADIATATSWAPNARCRSPLGCRCAVFFEHESLSDGEEHQFVEFASARGLRVTAQAVAAFHEEKRLLRAEVDRRLRDASRRLSDARGLEKSDPQQAVALYRKAVDGLMASTESPLDERQVRHDLPYAFNRLTMVLKAIGQEAEALDEIDRASSCGVLDRTDCGRKADREAVKNRGRRIREHLSASVGV